MPSTINVQELSRHLTDDGKLRVIDIRDGDAYGAGHIPGALHIPLLRLQYKRDLVPDDRPVVLYAGSSDEDQQNCAEAARTLEEISLQAQVLEGGLPAWVAAGFALEVD